VRTATYRNQPLDGGLVNHPASKLTQLALRNEVLHLSRGYAKPLSGLDDGE
jgi:hypothetical protein